MASQSNGSLASIVREIALVCRDSGTQWMLVVCLVVYFSVFWILERRMNPSAKKSGIVLFTFVVLCLANYAGRYETAARSTQVLALLAGMVLGRAISIWAQWSEQGPEQRKVWIVRWLVGLLAGAALYQPEAGAAFSYHGVLRWCGVWDNPNLYGLLMGTGVVLAAGLGIHGWQTECGRWKKILHTTLCLTAITLAIYGCFKSYSRGAWLGTVCGLVYLIWNSACLTPALSPRRTGGEGEDYILVSWMKRNRLALLTLLLSAGVLGFWQLRFSESRLAHRLVSVGNVNDFSWRNRVVAWQGATRMMLDRPVIGFGWSEAEAVYGKKYLPPQVIEGAAIQLNDFLMIGICAGVPALACFIWYLWFSLKKTPAGDEVTRLLQKSEIATAETGGPRCPTLPWPSSILRPPSSAFLAATCRAGAVVLLVGFWFDGGLFKLPVAALFWILLELARVGGVNENVAQSPNFPQPDKAQKFGAWLRGLAVLFVIAALGISAVHLVTPQMPVGKSALGIARKFLLHRKESDNFEWLAAQPIWSGKKMKLLLEHVQLATYNRELVNWKLGDEIYRQFVLSPEIAPGFDDQLDWRRTLWEDFYPRIRKETSLASATEIVARHLAERVTITPARSGPTSIAAICKSQRTDQAGFAVIFVASLRSVGVPARLNTEGHAEYFSESGWKLAP